MSKLIGSGRYQRETYAARPRVFTVQPITVDFGTVAPGTNEYFVPVPGAQVGNGVVVNPDTEFDANVFFVHYHIQSTGVLHLVLFNLTGAPVVIDTAVITVSLLFA